MLVTLEQIMKLSFILALQQNNISMVKSDK